MKIATRPRENLVVGVGFGIFSFSPEDHEIHHKSFQSKKNCIGKYKIHILSLIKITTRPRENLVVGGGVCNIFIFTRRPQDLPREVSI